MSNREVSLLRVPFRRTFDLVHLKGLHKWLFQDIYEWAGTTRSVGLTKGQSVFAKPMFIEAQARTMFLQLHSENLLRHVSIDDLAQRLAWYYGNLNSLHPFREGNGRTQRLFFRQLLGPRGLRLNWSDITADEKIAACVASHNGDDSHLAALFKRTLETK